MRKFLIWMLLVLSSISLATEANAKSNYVHGYTRRDGTYVQPYYRSSPDHTVTNNYSYSGNVNPYTGSVGSNRYEHDVTSPYYTGPDSREHSGHSSDSSGLSAGSSLNDNE